MVLTGVKLISSITGFFTNLPVIYNTQIQPSLTYIFDVIEKSVYNLEPAIVEALNNGFDQKAINPENWWEFKFYVQKSTIIMPPLLVVWTGFTVGAVIFTCLGLKINLNWCF